ncbi:MULTISPECIES: glutamate racemase [Bartonella]|uniref:glutamate racemase n=1 Tax=Bartonella TaxID=773 RepID=UPI0018DC5F50|nr:MULTISPECIES: aspartate/glutamate racemase family protein [Bartonella]
MNMIKPVAIFDAGIGSYAIVDLLHRKQPQRDIIYFADRANFPYGKKTAGELTDIMKLTFKRLMHYDPSAIIIASNAPSIMVFDDVKECCPVPLYGVFPPLEEAERKSRSGHVAIMGVASMVASPMGRAFVKKHSKRPENVALVNASSMVELVESGTFLFDPLKTQAEVDRFMADLLEQYPAVDTCTLSSTHLPWLKSFFEKAAPQCCFLDPAESVIAKLGKSEEGSGFIQGLVTESAGYGVQDFKNMLGKLGITIPLDIIPANESQTFSK